MRTGLLLLFLASPLLAKDLKPALVAPTKPRLPADEKKGFRLPPGFDIELVAADPAIQKPMNLAFDDRGRLWVTDTIEYPFPAKPGAKPRDTVKILSDFGPDGKARKITTFATGLNIPIGVLPLPTRDEKRTEALVFSIPHILHLIDTDGDGKADQRKVLIKKFGTRDTHGMTNAFTWGYDGWIYACHGFSNTSHVSGKDGAKITMNSGNTYRFRPDGTGVEYFTHGQVNPFGLAFDAWGNLFSADCHTKPLTQLLRGAWYSSFSKPHDGLGFGPVMMNHLHNSTGIAGIVHYTAAHFPKKYHGTLFVGNVVTSRVNHDRLKASGSSLRAVEQPDFLTSEDPWFRPVDLELGPDGAIYVADFYNRIIGHYEVPLTHPGRDRHRGRIWRIVYRGKSGTGKVAPPRKSWATATGKELIDDLKHLNLTVRTLAANQLVTRGGDDIVLSLRKLLTGKKVTQKVHGAWALHRLGKLKSEELQALCKDSTAVVRAHAFQIMTRWPESDKLTKLAHAALDDKNAFVQRAAVQVLGEHPSMDNLRALLDFRPRVPKADDHLLHVTRMAMRDHFTKQEVSQSINNVNWPTRESGLLADVALGAASQESAGFLQIHLSRFGESGSRMFRMIQHCARHGSATTRKRLLLLIQRQRKGLIPCFEAFIRGHQESGSPLSKKARGAIVKTLQTGIHRESANLPRLLSVAKSIRATEITKDLVSISENSKRSLAHRRAAMEALSAIEFNLAKPLLRRMIREGDSFAIREQSAILLGQFGVSDDLTAVSARLQRLLALGLSNSPRGANALMNAIEAGKASARLLQDREILNRLRQRGLADFTRRLGKLTRGLTPLDEKIRQLLEARRSGFRKFDADVAMGRKVFEKTCMACHQLQGKGVKIGPELDGVGIRGTDRLIEDILDPNRNVDQAFRQTTLELSNGKVVSGLLLRKEGKVLVLADSEGKEIRIPEKEVESKRTSTLSLMPSNVEEMIPEKEFYHLLRYLLTQKPQK